MKCIQCNTDLAPQARFCGACGHAVQATAQSPGQDPASASSMIGREIAGRYRLLAKLGEGGMGAVFRAEQISLKREVALKLLRSDLSSNAALLQRFDTEAKLVAKLRHPNTVTLYDFGQDQDGSTCFIAMELLDGQSLRQVLTQEGPMRLERALAIAEQVAASLADAHSHGIVHRDLKPDNVMLCQRGKKRDQVTVLDFGIAKLRDQAGHMTGVPVTQAGALLGTPQYMSPEQIRGETVDGRADVYAMGAMLYEMVTGRLPFEAPSLMGVLSMHLSDTPALPSARRPELGLPQAFDQLIMAALQKAPDQRPPSMDRFGEMLSQCRMGIAATPLPSQPPGFLPGPAPAGQYPSNPPNPAANSVAYAATQPHAISNHSQPPGAAALPTGAPATGAPQTGVPQTGVPGSPTHIPIQTATSAPTPKSRRGLWITISALALVAGGVAAAAALFSSSEDHVDGGSSLVLGDHAVITGSQGGNVSSDFSVQSNRRIFTHDDDDDDADDDDDNDNNIDDDDDHDHDHGHDHGPDPDVDPSAALDQALEDVEHLKNLSKQASALVDQARRARTKAPATRFRHPLLGYSIRLPAGFSQAVSPAPGTVQFVGTHKGIPVAVGVAPLDINPDLLLGSGMVDQATLSNAINMLAMSSGGTVVETKMQRIKGKPRLSGIIDDASNGFRIQYALLPCGPAGIMAYAGTLKAKFRQTRRFRRTFFEKHLSLP